MPGQWQNTGQDLVPEPPGAGQSRQAPRHSAAAPAEGTVSDTGRVADIGDLLIQIIKSKEYKVFSSSW